MDNAVHKTELFPSVARPNDFKEITPNDFKLWQILFAVGYTRKKDRPGPYYVRFFGEHVYGNTHGTFTVLDYEKYGSKNDILLEELPIPLSNKKYNKLPKNVDDRNYLKMTKEQYHRWKQKNAVGITRDPELETRKKIALVENPNTKMKQNNLRYRNRSNIRLDGGDFDFLMRLWDDVIEQEDSERIILIEDKTSLWNKSVNIAFKQTTRGKKTLERIRPDSNVDVYISSQGLAFPRDVTNYNPEFFKNKANRMIEIFLKK